MFIRLWNKPIPGTQQPVGGWKLREREGETTSSSSVRRKAQGRRREKSITGGRD